MSNQQEATDKSTEHEPAEDFLESDRDEMTAEEAQQSEQPEAENSEQEAVSVESLQRQLNASEKKAAENWDKMTRIQAEMENMKRRTQKDLESAHKFALEKFAKELLNVMDSLELGIQAASGDNPEVIKLREGSELTLKQLEAVFEKFNIESLNPIGQPFNPEMHQAMSMQPSADVEPNTVINVFQKGYVLNGRLIRPAMVVVSKKAEEKPAGDSLKIDEQA